LTGQAAGLNAGRKIVADLGVFVLTGIDADISKSVSVSGWIKYLTVQIGEMATTVQIESSSTTIQIEDNSTTIYFELST
jgi:hypothetical protein